MEYHFAYNSSTTKVVIIQQPDIRNSCTHIENEYAPMLNPHSNLEKQIGMPIGQIVKNKIRIYVIAKDQSCLMNKVAYKNNEDLKKIVSDEDIDNVNE